MCPEILIQLGLDGVPWAAVSLQSPRYLMHSQGQDPHGEGAERSSG